MAAGPAKRNTNRTRNGRIQAGQVVDVGPSTRKRPCCVEDTESEDGGKEACKSHSKRTNIQAPSHYLLPKVANIPPSAPRSSPRLRELLDVKAHLSPREERQTKRSTAPARQQDRRGPQFQKTNSSRPQRVNGEQNLPHQEDPQARPLESPKATSGKRQRDSDGEDEPNRAAKRVRQQSISGPPTKQVDYIEHWLDESCRSRTPSIADTVQLLEATNTMPRKSGAVLPSPDDSFERTTTSSRKSERTSASVHDSDYRQSLRHRNIHIERENPPQELLRRAHRIISRPRASPETDDFAIQELKDKSRRLQEDAEEEIVQQLAPGIIPAMNRLPDQKLARNADQPWANSVAVPLDPDILTNPLPLPRPKPDLAFGYSQIAFNHKQLMTIGLLVDDQFGRSYAVPDQKLRFPFLDIEFKSQAKNGTHYIGTSQAAGTGAVAINGGMELMQRSFGMEEFDYEEPQFFSVTMDHELARINVHWLKAPVDGGNHSFHVEGLSKHLLDDANGLRAVTRAIKNILDYGADTRLRTLCKALDTYREIVVRNREAANPHRPRRHEALPKVRGEQGRRSTQLALEETIAPNLRHSSVRGDISAHELVTEQRTTKRNRHGPGARQNVGTSTSKAAQISGSQHTLGSAGKSTYNPAPNEAGTTSRHRVTGGAEEPKRQIKPSQKLIESRESTSGRHGVKPRSKHHP